ncbi:MAG: cyclic nucleotide-binding protein [Proteobacteria bacterium]|nr:MAG: cyclic nucleotide-binding protein [Pseudomonadota bacterium]
MQQARIEALQRMPIFGGIRADVLEFLVARSSTARVLDGIYFFREGDKAQSVFVLESGRVAVLKLWEGREHLLSRLGPGDCFGEMALMDLFPRSASVLAEEPCTALELSTGAFFEIYQKDLEQFALMQMNLGREVSRRLRTADERLFRMKMGVPYTGVEGIGRLV